MEKYKSESISVLEWAKDIVSGISIEEKASQLRYDAPAIDRPGIPTIYW